ncbi:MAG: redoxin domain-containing protein [Cyanothece sp. SIO1E1]|nr:redoxin domain-containing protein [Cyanothece sp. SIO1E1]
MITACQRISDNPNYKIGTDERAIAQAAPLRINELAPDFSGIDSNGVTHQLSDFRGKVVVLEWTNHQCPFVRKHYGSSNMQTLQAEATAQGVVWLSVISSAPGQQGHVTAAKANELTTSRGASPTAVILDPDGQIGRRYSARTTPHMYVIDQQGKLRYMGGIDNIPSADPADVTSATNYVQAALNSLQAGQAVETAVTQPYGCSVKYSG